MEYEAAALARISSTIDSVFKDEALPYGHEEIYRVIKGQNGTFILIYLVELWDFVQISFSQFSVHDPLRKVRKWSH